MRGFEDWTEKDVIIHNKKVNRLTDLSKTKLEDLMYKTVNNSTGNKKSKYGANRVEIDGIKFDSQKEADYYCELKLRLAAGEIKGFCRQSEFILANNLRYKADFIVFNNDGSSNIIDVKGFKTDVYKLKKKIFEDKFDLNIEEV